MNRKQRAAAVALLGLAAAGTLAAQAQQAAPAPSRMRGDIVAGQKAFNRCYDCHPISPTVGHRAGPNLFGIIGRTAGTAPGYWYSIPLARSGFVWTEARMLAWLADPARTVPGNAMNFQGVPDPVARVNLVAYMATLK